MKFREENKKTQISQKKSASESKLRHFAYCKIDEVFEVFSSGRDGLTSKQVEKSRDESGANVITSDKKNNTFYRMREAFINPFNIVLLIVAIITFFTDIVFSSKPDYVTIGILLGLILISTLISFVQNERSNAAAEKLSKMISNKADVFRDGEKIEISIDEVVCGDIVKLSAGDMIPADVRFITTKDAFVAQAALTGESNPVEKFSGMGPDVNAALTDLQNIGFMGSNMVSGSATAIVLAIGNDTFFGSMAQSLSGDRAKNSFERGVDSVSRLLLRLMLIMVPIIFLINGITKNDWLSALLFAVSIAVGLTPEMLPVIMTSTLARGAVSMSKHKVIVKSLGAIQTFGEMDVLCTDKTGTLTEDKIFLERYMNVHGTDDLRILRYAYLNSYFQTGLKNLIDLAIINRATENELEFLLKSYTRVDEIPFDFSRRRMSVVLQDDTGNRQLITKGAVEEVMGISSYIELDGEVLPLTGENLEKAYRIYEKHNHDGLRMLAIARKDEVSGADIFNVSDESDMILIGFVGFLDPPKESAKTAIAALNNHGVRTVVVTGDSEGVAIKVCNKVGVDTSHSLTGKDVEAMDDAALLTAVEDCCLFAKMSPSQKERVVKAFQTKGHTVGYMGDGINDAPPLRQADVGISVDSAVDIAKETADIILLQKDLMVLEKGVILGRKTFSNIVKYIKMTASGNFGNMISVVIASILLPFMPMLPVQILTQNLLCDFSQMGIPFDSVDEEYISKPRRWEAKSIQNFMAVMGPLSSLFDILCFAVMWWIIGASNTAMSPVFQGGWFVFGTVSQILVIHMIRTSKIPFLQSNASLPLYISTFIVAMIALIIGFTDVSIGLDMMPLPAKFIPWLVLLLAGYCFATQIFKKVYVKYFKEWL